MISYFNQSLVFLFQTLHPDVFLTWSSAYLQQWKAAQCFPGAIVDHCNSLLSVFRCTRNKNNY